LENLEAELSASFFKSKNPTTKKGINQKFFTRQTEFKQTPLTPQNNSYRFAA